VGLGAVTFCKGLHVFPIPLLIPLTVVAGGGTLYAINQIIILVNRFRQGYACGLVYEGIAQSYDLEKPEAAFQVGVRLRNATDRPLQYRAVRFEVVIGGTPVVSPASGGSGGIIPRGATRRYVCAPLNKDQWENFRDKTGRGSINLEFLYGHPDGPFVRRLKMSISIDPGPSADEPAIADLIRSETDDAI
jgi:hypothetical protein